MITIRPCTPDDRATMLGIITSAAEAYRGVIPADRWHEPYMDAPELDAQIAAGVRFSGAVVDGRLAGVMGIQGIADVDLIRHAYVSPAAQRSGIGGALLDHLMASSSRPMLVGTWAAAIWAIAFYERHGFVLLSRARTEELLRRYWDIPDRQVQTSVVLERIGGPGQSPTQRGD